MEAPRLVPNENGPSMRRRAGKRNYTTTFQKNLQSSSGSSVVRSSSHSHSIHQRGKDIDHGFNPSGSSWGQNTPEQNANLTSEPRDRSPPYHSASEDMNAPGPSNYQRPQEIRIDPRYPDDNNQHSFYDEPIYLTPIQGGPTSSGSYSPHSQNNHAHQNFAPGSSSVGSPFGPEDQKLDQESGVCIPL